MKWTPRDIVALVLAFTILGTLLGLMLSELLPWMVDRPFNEAESLAWKDLLLVLIGAVAGYIGGSSADGR